MLYIPKIDDYLKILTINEVKDFVKNFGEYFKAMREKFFLIFMRNKILGKLVNCVISF